MNDSRDFQDAESVRSGHSHVTSQLVFFPNHPIPFGMRSRAAEKGRQAFGTHMVYRETFLQIQGAIEFWRLEDDLRDKFEHLRHWSDEKWKSKMAGGGGKNIFSELY